MYTRTRTHCSRMRVALEYNKISPFSALYGVNMQFTISTYDTMIIIHVTSLALKGLEKITIYNTLIHKQSSNLDKPRIWR